MGQGLVGPPEREEEDCAEPVPDRGVLGSRGRILRMELGQLSPRGEHDEPTREKLTHRTTASGAEAQREGSAARGSAGDGLLEHLAFPRLVATGTGLDDRDPSGEKGEDEGERDEHDALGSGDVVELADALV